MTPKIHVFAESLAEEKKRHQLLVKEYYPNWTDSFVSVAEDSDLSWWLQKTAHVDVLAIHDGRLISIDEKLVRSDFPNFSIETYGNLERNTPGWIYSSVASHLLYGFLMDDGISMTCYLINLPALREWFLPHLTDYKASPSINKTRGGTYTTECRLVPRSHVTRNVSCFIDKVYA